MNEILTDRLRISPLVEGDADAFHAIWGDPEVIFWGDHARERAQSVRGLARVIARCAAAPWPVRWHAIRARDSGEVVGDIVLQPAPFLPGELELGRHLRRDSWGRGFATEGASAVAAAAFATLGVPRLVCVILPTNERSARTALRIGFERAGTVVHADLLHDLWSLTPPASAGGRALGHGDRSPR